MKRIFVIISVFFLITNLSGKEKVGVSYFHVPPHIFYDDSTKKISGAVYDLYEFLAAAADVELVWDTAPSNIPRQIEQLAKGEIDSTAVFIYNPADLDKFNYSPSYFSAKDAIVVKTGNPLKQITKIDDILNLKIGYLDQAYISQFMSDKRIKWDNIFATNANEINLKKVLTGRIDAAYAPDHAALLYEIKLAKADKTLRLVYTPSNPSNFCIGFSFKKADIKKKFDETFKKFNGEKKYQELIAKYVSGK
jgi:ABC-type amino acid transport substrate-binding protein